jgi:GT2 family glycosyltransferase
MEQTTHPHVSFVVLGWNNQDLLDECFTSIKSQTYTNFSIVYVDNGSTDDSVSYVRHHHPDIMLVEASKNEGFAIGNNIGIKRALENKACRYVALINTDAVIAKDWLQALVDFALEHPHSGSFQTPTYDYYNHGVLDSYGIMVDHKGCAIQMGYRGTDEPPETRIVFGVNAAAALFSRTFLDAQPFGDEYLDADMWMYLEDVDIAARATIMGWNNWLVSQSAAYHMGSATSSKNPGFSVYYIYRNNFPMIYKNFPVSIILRMLPGLLMTDLKTVFGLLRNRDKVALKALLRGRLSGIKLLPKMHKKRVKLRRKSTAATGELWQLMKT